MITPEKHINYWVERYLAKELSAAEQIQLEQKLQADAAFKQEWQKSLFLQQTLQHMGERTHMREVIHKVAAAHKPIHTVESTTWNTKVLAFRKYLKPMAAAAALVIGSSLTTFLVFNKKDNNVGQEQYTLLRRKLQDIEASQSKIIDSLNKNKEEEVSTIAEVKLYGGTAFALSNDGYMATNYHVVERAKSIYIQTLKGDVRAQVIAVDDLADIAILKIEDRSFKFNTNATLPYTIANTTSGLGQRVFSMGYPKDEVVYNEGYISSESGYGGDKHSYQLEMTANPGQSGAPVLDKFGAVIGIITGKQSNTTGTTYAVQTKALMNLVKRSGVKIKMNDNNKLAKLDRTVQVAKIRDYVFAVKVN